MLLTPTLWDVIPGLVKSARWDGLRHSGTSPRSLDHDQAGSEGQLGEVPM